MGAAHLGTYCTHLVHYIPTPLLRRTVNDEFKNLSLLLVRAREAERHENIHELTTVVNRFPASDRAAAIVRSSGREAMRCLTRTFRFVPPGKLEPPALTATVCAHAKLARKCRTTVQLRYSAVDSAHPRVSRIKFSLIGGVVGRTPRCFGKKTQFFYLPFSGQKYKVREVSQYLYRACTTGTVE